MGICVSVSLSVSLSLSVVQVIGTYLKHFLCQSQNCRNCRTMGAWDQAPPTVFQPLLLLLRLLAGSWRPSMYIVYWYLVTYVFFLYDDCACSVLAAKHPLLFAEVHWTSLAAGRTTSPQALGWTAFPWQQGSTLDYPCQRGSSGICIPDIAGDNPCDIGPPSHGHWISMLGRQSLVLLCIVRWQSIFVLLCIE